MKKTVTLTVILTLLTLNAAAYSFGSFSYRNSKTVTGTNVSFTLGLINPGDSTLEVELEARGLENGEAVFPNRKIFLEPTGISENPAGEGWMSIQPGKYAKVEKVPFNVLMDRKTDEELEVRIEARKLGRDSSEGIRPEAVQVRNYRYSIHYPEDEEVNVSRGYDRDNEDDKGPEIVIDDEREQANLSDSTRETGKTPSNDSKGSKTSDDSNSTGAGIDTATLVLALSALGSAAYLWTVI